MAASLWVFQATNRCVARNASEQSGAETNKAATVTKNLWGDPIATGVMQSKFTPEEKALREQQLKQLKSFAAAKEKQAETLASIAGEDISAEARRFFDAAKRGDLDRVLAMYQSFFKRHRHFEGSSQDKSLDTSYWATMLEIDLAYECVIPVDPKSVQFFVNDTFNEIPPGSIYFGGTDSGRGLITAFSKSHVGADPFFTLTQNALADPSYLTYLRRMYGNKIYIPTAEDSSKCFNEYYEDARNRYKHDADHPEEPRQIRPGEDVKMSDGKLQISGQIAVMDINGRLVKVISDHNPKQEFYLEESFPLEWMNPYLEPHGPIMKLNRHELVELPAEALAKDRAYWKKIVAGKLGDWLTEETSVASVAKFADKIYSRKDLAAFSGDERYLQSEFAQKMVSKLRSSVAGLYAWRSEHAKLSIERNRMEKEADLAYRQAFALCPYNPEAVYGYVNLLTRKERIDDALLVAEAASRIAPSDAGVANLVEQLKQMKQK